MADETEDCHEVDNVDANDDNVDSPVYTIEG